MAVCPVDQAPPDGRMPRRSVPPDGRLPRRSGASGWSPAPDRTASNATRSAARCRWSARPPRSDGFDTHSVPMQTQKGDPVGSPFNSGTDQKNQLKVIVDDPYLYRSSFSFAAS